MTDATSSQATAPRVGGRAFALALVAMLAGAGSVGWTGAVAPSEAWAALSGVVVAALAVLLASLFATRVVRPASGQHAAIETQRLQALLGAGLMVKVVLLAVSFGAMALAGLKFSTLVAFALAFAAAALVLQFVVAFQLSRRLQGSASVIPATPR